MVRVNVRSYKRVRHRQVERVRAHTRRWPNQLSFGF
jgi:hypothetical protein